MDSESWRSERERNTDLERKYYSHLEDFLRILFLENSTSVKTYSTPSLAGTVAYCSTRLVVNPTLAN